MSNEIIPGFDDKQNDNLRIALRKLPNLDNGMLVILAGFIDTYNSSYFQEKISLLITSGYKNLILECTKLQAIASTGLGVLTNLIKMVNVMDGDIILVGVSPNILETLQLLGFERFIKIKPLIEDAYSILLSYAGKAPSVNMVQESGFFITCPSCKKSLQASRAGKFRCSNCKSIIIVQANGEVTLENLQ